MPCALRNGLSFCEVDGQLIFLDVDNDRYFQLSEPLRHSFLCYMARKDACATHAACLIEHGILVESSADSDHGQDPIFEHPSNSAIELTRSRTGASFDLLLEVFAIVCWTKLQLKTKGLKSILLSLNRVREESTQRNAPAENDPTGISGLLKAASVFREARIFVPVETRCLLDSIAIVKFLARRHFHANIVIGVTGDPFSAHCWAQIHDMVLNDTVGNVRSFTPIRVI